MMAFIIFIEYDRKRKAERMRLSDDMFCSTCKSTFLTHFLETTVLQKKLVVYHPLTKLCLASVGFLLIIETLIIILATKVCPHHRQRYLSHPPS